MRLFKNILGCLFITVFFAGCASLPERYDDKYVKNPSRLTIYSNWFADPRNGISSNEGEMLSFREKWEAVPIIGIPASFINAFTASKGLTDAQYAFEKYLESPADDENIDLILNLYERNLIKQTDAETYISYLLDSGFVNNSVINAMLDLNMHIPKQFLIDDVTYRRWFAGHGFNDDILDSLNLDHVGLVKYRLKQNLKGDIYSIMPLTVIQTENMDLISTKEADEILKYRFYQILADAYSGRIYSQRKNNLSKEDTRMFQLRRELANFHKKKTIVNLNNIRKNNV